MAFFKPFRMGTKVEAKRHLFIEHASIPKGTKGVVQLVNADGSLWVWWHSVKRYTTVTEKEVKKI